MGKKFWNLYAPIYKLVMKPDKKLYEMLYEKIPPLVNGKEVLEVATGPGLIAKKIAPYAKNITATDFAEGMIRKAKKGNNPDNLNFEVADAKKLPYEDKSFDVVIIANALHIMPDANKALNEAKRVLKNDGTLIAPNFVEHNSSKESTVWTRFLEKAGVSFEHTWIASEYKEFLEENGWNVEIFETEKARMTLAYAVCKKNGI